MSSLPTEIITDILSREPIKDLLRFRCVSKPWCSLIDGPDFIKLHLKRSTQTYSNTTLVLKHHEQIYFLNLGSQNFEKLDHPFSSLNSPNTEETQLIGCCNGLLCLSNTTTNNDVVTLWNPSTRKHRILPFWPIRLESYNFMTYGFGYDHVNHDYNVMRVVQLGSAASGGGTTFKTDVGIYSLKLNSWKRVEDFPYELCFKDCGVFVSGALHFMVISRSPLPITYIVAFDLVGAPISKYRLVPFPQPVEENTYVMNVGVMAGCLDLICFWPALDIDIWVMNDYGVKASWTKLICIPAQVIGSNFGYVKPLAYSESGDAVLLWQELQRPDCVKLLWYDLEKRTQKDVRIRGVPILFEPLVFVGSLVPVKSDSVIGMQKTLEPPKGIKKEGKGKKRDDFLSTGFKLTL